ncbi:MAG: pyridoxal 5'-phosphate synthase lyase subunit PdxS, partial [bacterium]
VFVGSGIFKSDNPEKRGKAIVDATTHYQDAMMVANASRGLGEAMKGISAESIPDEELLQTR